MKKIVMIDPAETFIKFVSHVLRRMGYEVYHAFDLESGLAVIAETHPNLILAEINIPNCKGVKICEILRCDPRTATIPLVIVTTDGNAQSMEQAKKAGCSDYLTKPLTARDIHLMLQRNLPFVVKRQILRLNIELDAIIRTKDQTFETRTKTLGEGGLLVQIDHPAVHTGSQVGISLPLTPSSPPLELTGEVIYVLGPSAACSLHGVGIKFSDISKDTTKILRNFMEQTASAEPETSSVAPCNK